MARKSVAQLEVPGTESPDRDDELHALGLEILDCEARLKEAKAADAEKRAEAAKALEKRGLTEYDVDGISLWIEPGKEKVKAKREGDRPKGKVQKVTEE